MKILFNDIPRGLPFTFRQGIEGVKGAGRNARVQMYPKPAKPVPVFIRHNEVCEITDALADLNNLGRFGIPPRPDTPQIIVPVRAYGKGAWKKARAALDELNKVFDVTPEGNGTKAKDDKRTEGQ